MPSVDFEEMGRALLEDIKTLDEQLDSYQDPSTIGKRKVTGDLIEQRKGSWGPVAEKIVENLNGIDGDAERFGSFLGLQKALREAFGDAATKFIEATVEAAPKSETVEVSDDVKKAVAADRSEKYMQFKQLRTMLVDTFGKVDADDPAWTMPAVRRANVGKRGKRAINQMNWAIDGTELNPEETTYKDVAIAVGFEKAAQLTEALKAAGINTTKPGEGFDVTVNGKNLVATLKDGEEAQYPDPAGNDTEDDESEEDDS